MPAALQKVPVLGGRGVILEYSNRPGKFYYRELVEGCRRYRSILIKGASSMDDAQRLAIDAFGALREQQVNSTSASKRQPQARREQDIPKHQQVKNQEKSTKKRNIIDARITVSQAIEQFLASQQEKCEAGMLKEGTLKEKRQVLRIHLARYLEMEGVSTVSDIERLTFERYLLYRKDTTKLTRRKELSIIRDFVRNHLVRNGLLEAEVGLLRDLMPKVTIKREDLNANPAISGEDWRIINSYIRRVYVKGASSHPRKSVEYWRMLFWTFTIVAKNTGCRPNELLNLRWRDVQFEDIGSVDSGNGEKRERLIAHIVVVGSKTGEQREIPSNSGDALRRWLLYQRKYLEEQGRNLMLNQDTLVFGNPSNEMRSYTYTTYTAAWKKIMEGVGADIKGNKFSPRSYTIYSMRSTFIEGNLAKGMDIFLLARLCGHSVAILMKHYERLDIRRRSREITHIDYGKKKYRARYVDVLEDRQSPQGRG